MKSLRETDAQKKEDDEMFKEYLKVKLSVTVITYTYMIIYLNSFKGGCLKEESRDQLQTSGEDATLDLTKVVSCITTRITRKGLPKGNEY